MCISIIYLPLHQVLLLQISEDIPITEETTIYFSFFAPIFDLVSLEYVLVISDAGSLSIATT